MPVLYRGDPTHLVFLGMEEDEEVEGSVLDLKAYAVVLVRFEEDTAVVGASSSESASGAARFFPFRSLIDSLMVKDEAEADGKVALRALAPGENRCQSKE